MWEGGADDTAEYDDVLVCRKIILPGSTHNSA